TTALPLASSVKSIAAVPCPLTIVPPAIVHRNFGLRASVVARAWLMPLAQANWGRRSVAPKGGDCVATSRASAAAAQRNSRLEQAFRILSMCVAETHAATLQPFSD